MNAPKISSIATTLALGVCLIAGAMAVPYATQRHLTDQEQQERARELEKVGVLIRDGELDKAELLLNGFPEQSFWGVAELRANICIRRDDHSGALEALRTIFEPHEKKSIGGAEELRTWYYLLLLERRDTKDARRVRADLLSSPRRKPGGSDEFFEFEGLSQNPLVAVYLYMASLEFAAGYTYRARAYISTAKKLDSGVKVDEVLISQLKRVRTTPEAELRYEKKSLGFPMLPNYDQLVKMVSLK
ncbi:MAG: hypothetical protein WCK51_04520 [Armatimonadota bacterium]